MRSLGAGPRRRALLIPALLLLLHLRSSLAQSSSGSGSRAAEPTPEAAVGDPDLDAPPDPAASRPHCQHFRDHCVYDATSASCTFTQSVAFSCVDFDISNAFSNTTATNTLNPSVDDCRWELTGDLIFAANVSVQVLGDDCFLQISVGQMLLLGTHAALQAATVSVDAAFARLEPRAKITAAFSGHFQGLGGLFPGSGGTGASFGGSGGRRVRQPQTMGRGPAFGFFFDVREMARSPTGAVALDAPMPSALEERENKTHVTAHEAARGWNLEPLWDFDEEDENIRLRNARLLMGSGSRVKSADGVVRSVGAGGRIRVVASRDLVLMKHAVIKANGAPAIDGAGGGSGGSIYVSANALSLTDGHVQAHGGDAFCRPNMASVDDCFPAGGGGRVHIAYASSQLEDTAVDVSGGLFVASERAAKLMQAIEVRALAGAPGTYFLAARGADKNVETRLLITNTKAAMAGMGRETGVVGGAVTSLTILASEMPSNASLAPLGVDVLTIRDCAAVATRGLQLPTGEMTVVNGSYILDEASALWMPVPDSVLPFETRKLTVSDRAELLFALATTRIQSGIVSMDASSRLTFAKNLWIESLHSLHMDAIVEALELEKVDTATNKPSLAPTLTLRSGGDMTLGNSTRVGALYAWSDGSIGVDGKLEALRPVGFNALFLPCKQQQPLPPNAMMDMGDSNYSVTLQAMDSISIGSSANGTLTSIVRASAILMCATDEIVIQEDALVTSTGLGLLANQGLGKGECVASIGGGGGYGGRGADSSATNEVGDFASGGLAYGTKMGIGMVGSGGGCVEGGASGGVVLLGAKGVVLDGAIHCDGAGGVHAGGGGSGGYLGVTISEYFRGNGAISSVGGGSDCMQINKPSNQLRALEQAILNPNVTSNMWMSRVCGGGGAGGRLQLHGCEQQSITKCASGFLGNYTVAGGATATDHTETPNGIANPTAPMVVMPAASGSFFGFPCPRGSGGLFCRVCAVGTFKSESSSDECQPCTNSPSNAHYVGTGSVSGDCDWSCNPGYSGGHCVTPLQQLLDACGGLIGFALILSGIVTFFTLIGYACRSRKEPSYVHMCNFPDDKRERQHLLTSAISNSPRTRCVRLFRWLYWPRVAYPKLLVQDLPEHMARIYLSGANDRDAPLRLRLTVPPALESVLYADEFKILAERINSSVRWRNGICSSWGAFFYNLMVMLCYPYASSVLSYRRHIRVNALKRLVGTYNHACMKGPRARGLLNALKLGYSSDYSLVYLELLYKESSQSACVPTTKIGKPSLPSVLLFAGRGTYRSPLFLDPSDLLVRSVPQCPELTSFIDEAWVELVASLNELLRVVRMDEGGLVETLLPVAEFLERRMAQARSNPGLLGGLRMSLGRFYVGDEDEFTDEFKLGLLLTTASDSYTRVPEPKSVTTRRNHPRPASALSAQSTLSGRFGPSAYPFGSGPQSRHADWFDPFGSRAKVDSFGSSDPLLMDLDVYTPPPVSSAAANVGQSASNGNGNGAGPTVGSNHSNGSIKTTGSSIREEALRIRTSTSGSLDGGATQSRANDDNRGRGIRLADKRPRYHRAFYESWAGMVDMSLPVPGILISVGDLQMRLARGSAAFPRFKAWCKKHLLPQNVPRSPVFGVIWMLNIALLILVITDMVVTFATVVNLRCVINGEVDRECSAAVLLPVLLLPPLTLVLSPIMGVISLAIASASFSRRFAVWNALSTVNVLVVMCVCLRTSSRLVRPWFTAPVPLLPLMALLVKAGQAFLIERYIAFQETSRRRPGWRGLMKRRLSDASLPPQSPYASPVANDSKRDYLSTTLH